MGWGVCGEEGFGLLFGVEDGGVELAAGYFFGRSTVEAELADGEAVAGGDEGWAEGAAEDGTGSVEVAGLGGGVEGGAGLVVGEGVEGFESLWGGGEDSGVWVAGKGRGEAGGGGPGARADGGGASRFSEVKGVETFAQAVGVQGGDGEDAVAALRAAGAAGQPVAGAVDGVGEGAINDLDELVRRDHHM